jgi:TRAP-type uncharacterized transport system substrate-binding protein
LARTNGIPLTVSPSKGSIENIYAVYDRPNVQLGIVQSDVLAFVARVQTDPGLKRIAKKTRMVFPLYNEEVHVLAAATSRRSTISPIAVSPSGARAAAPI